MFCNLIQIIEIDFHIDGLMQDCSISMANALQILQTYI